MSSFFAHNFKMYRLGLKQKDVFALRFNCAIITPRLTNQVKNGIIITNIFALFAGDIKKY